MKYKIDIHADDYGYSLNTSKDLLSCMKDGLLDSISIICNMPSFDESIELLCKEIKNLPFLPMMSVHINLVEGDSLSKENMISDDGLMSTSWKDLFVLSYGFKRKKAKEQIKKEMSMQISKTWDVVLRCMYIAEKNNVPHKQIGLRIDSHVHTHLVPVVWEALIEVLEEEKYDVEFIRNPKEPIVPFLKITELWGTYSIINIIKNRILMFYSRKVDRYCESHKLDKMYMWGLIMSGGMDGERIEAIYDDMSKYAKDKERYLEILFHPGLTLTDEYCKEMNKESSKSFNMSVNRHIEKSAVENMSSVTRR